MNLLIGCPISRREWIIREYLQYATAAANKTGFEYNFIFVISEQEKELISIIQTEAPNSILVIYDKPKPTFPTGKHADHRSWSQSRYQDMVELRNVLLTEVRHQRPDLFLSLDSDILIHEDAIQQAYAAMIEKGYDAIGLKTYLSTYGVKYPSFGMFKNFNANTKFKRYEATNIMKVDIIMAMKLMTPKAYNVDYSLDPHGEDIGWSVNCRKSNVILGWDGRTASKHVMDQKALTQEDKRCGY